jgi:thiol-disulfide isomerase/thioredoxin
MKTGFLVLMTFLFIKMHAQQPRQALLRKVTATEVRTMIDSASGPMIINFWATWCGPCIREIPWFDSIIAVKNAPVRLLLVSLDSRNAYPFQLSSFVKSRGYKGEVVYLDDHNIKQYTATIEPRWKGVIPASIFVNHNTGYYQVFNEQIPKQRFGLELEKLMSPR